MGIEGGMAPQGLWMYANSFVKSASALPPDKEGFNPAPYHLVCHGIELILKALLSLRGKTMLELAENSYGHNLERILAAAKENALSDYVTLSQDHDSEILKAAVCYEGKVFEYPAPGEAMLMYPNLPSIEILLAAATLLVEGLESPCKDAP
jgi:hypothetical protein